MKRITALILALITVMSVSTTAFASSNNEYTFVFVHGMGGWGPDCSIDKISPYWGSITGSLSEYLTEEGYSVAEATVGPFSSAWDRACELYAQLMGTTVDYGEAHSTEHNHERYGKTYTTPIVKKWNSINKINLIGHSFGGNTIRLLTSLMTYGCEDEILATGKNTSPLFTGNKESWINSVTTLDSPHNGTTLYNILDVIPGLVKCLLFTVNAADKMLKNSIINNFYDIALKQFDINNFYNGTDNTGYDLSPEGAAELNNKIKISENIYYFSYASVTTNDKNGILVPNKNTFFILKPTSFLMGQHKDDIFMQENDGLVNLNSALYPFNEPHVEFNTDNIQRGVWNVMPILKGHHGTIIGMDGNTEEIHEFYIDLLNLINNL